MARKRLYLGIGMGLVLLMGVGALMFANVPAYEDEGHAHEMPAAPAATPDASGPADTLGRAPISLDLRRQQPDRRRPDMTAMTITNKSNTSAWLVLAVTAVALLIGWGLKGFAEGRTRAISEGGFSATVPAGWLVARSD